jgi:ATP-dependent DNA helicase DinG
MRAADVLGPRGPLARAISGYEHREAQLAMAALVEDTLARADVSLIEAGTGTGKTLAYLVPAILSGQRVVVSTGTKTLQDQIMHRDLPALEAHLGMPVSAASMKGLSNYLCLRRYEELVNSPEAAEPQLARGVDLLRKFRGETHTGERSELALPDGSPLWARVESGSDTRIGQRCAHYEACFVTRMRRAAEEAKIIVVNHHLFFADLALRSGYGNAGVIPDYDAVIFDEAHQIEDVVTEFFGTRLSTTRVEVLLRDAERALAASADAAEARRLVQTVAARASAFFAPLRAGSSEGARKPLTRDAFHGPGEALYHAFDAALEALSTHAAQRAYESETVAQIARRTERLRKDLTIVADAKSEHVSYVDARGARVAVAACPVDIGPVLREHLFDDKRAVVLTSATLQTSGSFDFVKRRLGLDFPVHELALASPFDYTAQAALYTPSTLPEPRSEAFIEAAADEIVGLIEITGGGAFVLCTSLRMMQQLHAACVTRLPTRPLLQGMAPKPELLETFRRRGDAVLFASASFWEGVDVPGHALRLVVIDKLPFDVPTDPLVRARCRQLEADGGAPFMDYLVPSAALALKQGFGRLIRSRADRGVVAVLDRRLSARGYGKVFLDSLPPASRCYSRAEVAAFWEDGVDQGRMP